MMNAKEIGKELLDRVVEEGSKTDYFYSPNFYKWAKELAINRAKSKYSGDLLKNIVEEIENL